MWMIQPLIKRKRCRKSYSALFSPDPNLIQTASTPNNLINGLKILDRLWTRGIVPAELRNHYFLTWLAYGNGNISRLSKTLGLNRNTLVLIFKQKLKKRYTFKLRVLWNEIRTEMPGRPFSLRLHQFYRRVFSFPRLSELENESMTNFWLMGVKQKDLLAHYFLWALRRGMNIKKMSKILGMSDRSVMRAREYALRPGSPAKRWLEPMKVKESDWFFDLGRKWKPSSKR
jgi:hypothetical protein